MVRRRMLIVRMALVALVATAAMVGARAIAAVALDPTWVTVAGGTPLFDLDAVAPGDTGQAGLTITNPQAFPVTFTIAAVSVRNDDNGCNEPEREAGDTTCGVGGGELQDDLVLTLTDAATGSVLVTGTLAQWAAGPVADPFALGAHQTRSYVAGYELPIGASNRIQSDLVSFVFEMQLRPTDGTQVASDAPTVSVDATSSLPATGTDVRVVAVLAGAAALVGVGLHRATRRRGVEG